MPQSESTQIAANLAGLRFSAVEDETLIALDPVDTLEKFGADTAQTVSTEQECLDVLAAGRESCLARSEIKRLAFASGPFWRNILHTITFIGHCQDRGAIRDDSARGVPLSPDPLMSERRTVCARYSLCSATGSLAVAAPVVTGAGAVSSCFPGVTVASVSGLVSDAVSGLATTVTTASAGLGAGTAA
jgi:hypothetical protein